MNFVTQAEASSNLNRIEITSIPQISKVLKHFIPAAELNIILYNAMKSEESKWFKDTIKNLYDILSTMPKTYEQDGLGNEAIVYLHYFSGGNDWYIIERDERTEQYQAFGYARLGNFSDGELGYISIKELISNNVELDLHWTPKTLRECLS